MNKSVIPQIIDYFSCAVLAIAAMILIKSQSPVLSLHISLAIGITSIFNVKRGLLLWLVVAPLSSTISDQVDSIPLLFNPALVFGWIINSLSTKRYYNLDKKTLLLFTYLVVSILIVTAIYGHANNLIVIISFVLVFLISYLIGVLSFHSNHFNRDVSVSLLLSAVVALVTALNSLGSPRLDMEGSVRQLSNVLAFSGLFILINLLFVKHSFNPLLKYILSLSVFPIIIGLGLTVSRGSILAFLASFLATALFYFMKKGSIKLILSAILYVAVTFTFLYFLLKDFFTGDLSIYIDVLQKRFEGDNLSSGSSVRQYIWEEVLGRFNVLEFLFGVGIDGFKAKAAEAGISFYAHSFFVDTIATGGILALFFIILYLLDIIVYSLRRAEYLGFALVIFIVANFLTHGMMVAPLFWIGLSLARGAVVRNRVQVPVSK